MKVILEKYFEPIRKLFLEIGIKSITMDDICNELGISKKHFINISLNMLYLKISDYLYLTENCSREKSISLRNKANILKRAVEKENLTLAHSVGVGDTESDVPFLEMVARPICFNPNAVLYRYAKRMKWKVVVERKDVVYEL